MQHPGPPPFAYQKIEWATDCAYSAYIDRWVWEDEAENAAVLKQRQQIEFLAWVLFETYGPVTAQVLETVADGDVFQLTVEHLRVAAAVLQYSDDDAVDLDSLVYLEMP